MLSPPARSIRDPIGATLAVFILLAAGLPATAEPALPSKGVWLVDVRHALHGSMSYLDRRVGRGGAHLAVNLDIDNTSLATHYAPGHAVAPVLRFAQHARDLGVRVLFNTARLGGHGRSAHARGQLTAAGFPVTDVCGRRAGESLAQGKQRCRRRFVNEGYALIANVGNRQSDFAGGHYERAFRLPRYHGQLG